MPLTELDITEILIEQAEAWIEEANRPEACFGSGLVFLLIKRLKELEEHREMLISPPSRHNSK